MPDGISELLVGAALVLIAQGAQSFYKKRNHHHETLMGKYADFVATASDELNRVKSFSAGLVTSVTDGNHTELHKLDDQRHEFRKQLNRIAFQIRVLEDNLELTKRVEILVKSQAFMMLAIPPMWHDESYQKRFDGFENQILEFEKMLSDLIDLVIKVRSHNHGYKLERWGNLLSQKLSSLKDFRNKQN